MRAKLSLLLIFLTMTLSSNSQSQLMSMSDVLALPVDPPALKSSYGADPLQFGELRLPEGEGPHPVVMILHGGCWLNAYDLHLMDPMATSLTRIPPTW